MKSERILDEDPPIQEVIDANVIPRLVGYTEKYEEPQLQVRKNFFNKKVKREYYSMKLLGL